MDALFDDAKPHLDAVAAELGQPTEFEALTALGLWHFARKKVGAAVLEVGLGGRWDATNVANPLVSVITHVALDHCDRLGDTLEAIAADKVEIARPDRVLVTAETKNSVLRVFQAFCDARGTRFWPILAPAWSNDAENLQKCLAFTNSRSNFHHGGFQSVNRQTALAAFYAFQTEHSLPIHAPSFDNFVSATVPGRLEIVRENPRVILDVCNNPDGALHLAHALRDELIIPRENLILVLGILADKDFAAMTELLAPLAKTVIATQSQSPRAAAELLAIVARRHCEDVETLVPISEAVTRALDLAAPHDTICIAGSFTTVGEVDHGAVFRRDMS